MATLLLLSTKFLVPRPQPDQLRRAHLLCLLGRAVTRKLVLLSAPPGYGKTTLLASYARETSLPLIWYQLDPADNDPIVFLQYLTEGFRQTFPDFGRATLALLEDQRVQVDRVRTVLLNEVTSSLGEEFLVVLEDYHAIHHPEVHRLLDFLLDHQPPNLHLLISTRVEPPLSLASLRASGDLVELRTQDLRFSSEEIAQLTAHLGLSDLQLQLLEERTEGWAAGLQLALTTLAQKSPASADGVIQHFRGSNRYVFDYLAQEVFQGQSPQVQDFLLRSSVLTQMGAVTCNTILGIADAQALLGYLERQNLFIVGLDEERRWYRYHQLFRDFLLDRLYQEAEAEALRLQATAGDYHAGQGLWDLAAEHYMAAHSSEGLARSIRALAPVYLHSGRLEALYRYLLALPLVWMEQEPDFLLYQGQVLQYWGRIEEAVTCYERALALYQARAESASVSRVLTELAHVALSKGRYRRAQELARAAVERAGEADHAERGEALMALAVSTGFLEGMDRGYELGEAALQEADLAGAALSRSARARLLLSQAQIDWWYGDPFATVAHCQAALAAEGEEVSPVACRAYVVMVSPHLYWGNLPMARQLAEKGLALSEQLQFTEWRPMAHAALGNVLSRQDDLAAAEKHFRQAIALSRQLGLESYAQLMASAYLASTLSQQGRLSEARQACEEALHLYASDPETFEFCVCRSVLGDVLMDMGDLDTAWEYFLNLRQTNEARQFRLPLAMVYFALGYLHLLAGRREAALDSIRRSMEIIRHTNAIVLYLDQGQRAVVVCRAAQQAGICPEIAERVLSALAPAQTLRREPLAHPSASGPERSDAGPVEVITLGGFQVFHQGQELGKEAGLLGKPRELLAYFITHRSQRLPLDRILEDLWPGSDRDQGQAVFHTTLHRLRRALVRVAGPGGYVRHESGEYQLERERFQIDADFFDTCLGQARASVGKAAIRSYEAAVQRYRGSFLISLYCDWCEPERRRLATDCQDALRNLVAHYRASGEYRRAIAACERILELDPLQEQVHCDLMRFWHRLGNRAAVVKQYQTLTHLLREEIGVDPMPEIQAVYAELVGDSGEGDPAT